MLLKDPRSKRLLDSGDRYDNTPLHVSAERGLLTVVTALLDAEADVDNKNEDEQTPLHLAAKQGRTRCVGVAVGRGPSVKSFCQ